MKGLELTDHVSIAELVCATNYLHLFYRLSNNCIFEISESESWVGLFNTEVFLLLFGLERAFGVRISNFLGDVDVVWVGKACRKTF
jgi:hypothetical protein